MTNSIRLFALPALLLTLCSTASAEGHRGKGDFAMHRTAKLQKHLDLSDEQANKVYEVFKSVKKDSNCKDKETFTEKRDCRMAKKESIRKELSAILTEEQLTELDQLHEKRKERRKKHRH